MTMRCSAMDRKRMETRDGFVLVTVLWLLAILSVIAIGFSHSAMLERRVAWYGMDQAQAQAMARGAVNRAVLELGRPKQAKPVQFGANNNRPTPRQGQFGDLLQEGVYSSQNEDSNTGEDVCMFWIVDCESRISLNDAPQELLENMKVLGSSAVNEIMARRERKDNNQRQRFSHVDEILGTDAGKGIDEEVWYGTAEEEGIRSLLTVWGTDGLININTASYGVLSMIPGIDKNVVARIVAYRMGPDEILDTQDDRTFSYLFDVSGRIQISAEKLNPIYMYCKTESQLYKITTHATRRRGKISAYCTVIVDMQTGKPVIRDWKEGIIGS